jgi:hypothetical protein
MYTYHLLDDINYHQLHPSAIFKPKQRMAQQMKT